MVLDMESELGPPKPLESRKAAHGSYDDPLDEHGDTEARSWAPVIFGFLIVAALAAVAYFYFFQPEMLRGVFVTGPNDAVDAATQPDTEAVAADTAPEATDAQLVAVDMASTKPDVPAADALSASKMLDTDRPDTSKREKPGKVQEGGRGYEGSIAKGNAALRSGDKQRALQAFSAAVRANPRSSEAHRGLGWAYIRMGLHAGAIKAFKRAIELNPGYGDAYIGLGKAYRASGQKQAAVRIYERYLARYPSGPSASIARHQVKKLRAEIQRAQPNNRSAPDAGAREPGPGGKEPAPTDGSKSGDGPGGGATGNPSGGATTNPLPNK